MTKQKSKRKAAEPDSGSGSHEETRLFEMPYTAAAPRLINPDLGLHNLVARAGHNVGYSIDVTLLDAPDHRLIRSGVLLAHRVLDGRGEWYLGAPAWAPHLPEELIEPMGHAEMPEHFADLIKPFRRRATLGPVAALSCDRREFALRDDHGTTMALARDDRVTVRRGGLTTARFREVMITPVGPGLKPEQLSWLHDALTGAGGTPVSQFPRLVTRLGAPATGLSDFPASQSIDPEAPFEAFVSRLLARRLRAIVVADLAVRNKDLSAVKQLAEQADLLRQELEGISAALAPEWTEDLEEELDWIADLPQSDGPGFGDPLEALRARFQGERYLSLLERLVNAARAPKLGESAMLATADVVGALLDNSLTRLRKAGARFAREDSTAAWDRARLAGQEAQHVVRIVDWVFPRQAERLRTSIAKAESIIEEAGAHRVRADELAEEAATLEPTQAFEHGRLYEQQLVEHQRAYARFADRWDRVARKLVPGKIPTPEGQQL